MLRDWESRKLALPLECTQWARVLNWFVSWTWGSGRVKKKKNVFHSAVWRGRAKIQMQFYLTPKFTLVAVANQGRKSNVWGIKEDGLVTKLGQELEHFPQIPTVLSHFTS